jgi:hypothetical protein
MFYDKKGAYCGCAPGIDTPAPSRCNSCSTCRMSRYPDGRGAKCSCIADKCKGKCDAAGCPAEAVQKKIWKQVRVPTSLFTMARSAITVRGGPANLPQQRWGMVNWNQMSDRAVPGQGTAYIPSRGSTTQGTTVAHRPGAGGDAGRGVDVKHGSYARYLNRLKAPLVKTQRASCSGTNNGGVAPKYGNKRRKVGMISDSVECCGSS